MLFAVRRAPGVLASAVLFVLGLGALPVRAAVPEQSFPAQQAPPDTGQFLPRWLHLHGSVGYGWLSSPSTIRQRYEAGQDFEFGLEARLRPRLRMRLNAEYQVLPAVGELNYTILALGARGESSTFDTLSFDWRQRGWLGAGRAEVQYRAFKSVWLLAGAGYGYMAAGVRPYHFEDPFGTVDIRFPGSSGWGVLGSTGLRYEFAGFGPVLGAEVRWSTFSRRQDDLQLWSIRIGWQGK
ncbi:MAG: hypothetical protein ABL977_12260 [Candidatus Eisenbacteria bacterium]